MVRAVSAGHPTRPTGVQSRQALWVGVLGPSEIVDLGGLREVGTDAVDPDAVPADPCGERGREVRRAGFHRGVDRLARIAPHALDRMEIDDAASSGLDHAWQERVGHSEEMQQVDLVHRLP